MTPRSLLALLFAGWFAGVVVTQLVVTGLLLLAPEPVGPDGQGITAEPWLAGPGPR